ncbi:MAG: hypothetical protein Q4F00_10510 [bacterium]|nr:hypothetical protein [bacterium]
MLEGRAFLRQLLAASLLRYAQMLRLPELPQRTARACFEGDSRLLGKKTELPQRKTKPLWVSVKY